MKSITISNLTFSFTPDGPRFFDDVTFELPRGKISFLTGANGSGKSTLFKVLLNQKIARGTLAFDNQTYTLDQLPAGLIAHVPQHLEQLLIPTFTVQEQLRCAQLRNPQLKHLAHTYRYGHILERLGICPNSAIEHLSGGQRQIVACLMALQQHPLVLLLDEPTAALDEANAHLVMDLLSTIAQEFDLAILIICHDSSLRSQYCNGTLISLHQEPHSTVRTLKSLLAHGSQSHPIFYSHVGRRN